MPLGEISSNIDRPVTSKQNGSQRPPIRPSSHQSFAKPPPIAVQSMLKSDTEIGDVGIFAQRPPRVPRSATQSSLAASSYSATGSSQMQRNARQSHSLPRSQRHPHTSGVQRMESTRSSRSAYYTTDRRRRGPNPYPYQHHQYAAFEPEYQRRLHSHKSLASLNSPSDTSTHRPYRQRPRYPVSVPSPAVSNVYEYRYPSDSRQNSLRSEYSAQRSHLPSADRTLDHSLGSHPSRSSFRNMASPVYAGLHSQFARHPSFAPATTPVPQNGRLVSHENVISPSATPASPAESIVPFYYDYSESFHGQEALLLNERPDLHDGEPDGIGTSVSDIQRISAISASITSSTGSHTKPVELPTRHNRRPSELSIRHRRKASSKSNRVVQGPQERSIKEESEQNHMSLPTPTNIDHKVRPVI